MKCRVKKTLWYLLTNEHVKKEDQAWESVFAYKRRWQIELSFRYGKCELAMESPRVWSFENRLSRRFGLWHLKDARKVLRKFGMTHKYNHLVMNSIQNAYQNS